MIAGMSTQLSPHGAVAEAYRPVAMGLRGVVCSGHPLASQAGMQALQRGGNAVDAAIATGAALGVVEPMMSGIGGDGFIMVYSAREGAVSVVNATGAAPARATREEYASAGIPMKGIRSVSVPGILGGWVEAHQRFGALRLADVLAPAIELAEEGFPVTATLAAYFAAEASLATFPSSRKVYAPEGRTLRPGELLVQRDLADTYRAVAEGGAGAFYHGPLARAIAGCSERERGLLSSDDLASYRAVWQKPLVTGYHGFDVYGSPPNSSGHVLLQELNIAERFDLAEWGIDSPRSIHVMVEAKKRAFADREAFTADPDFADVPIAGLLSKEYAGERAASISLRWASDDVRAGDPWRFEGRPAPATRRARRSGPSRGDTTCLCVVDRWGNAANILQSVQGSFGSGLIVDGTGVLLNNRMTYWHLDPDHVDCLEPGKRVRHTMNTVMALRDGAVAIVCGTPGADTQVQTNMQLLAHVIDAGYSPVEAVEAPRWRHLQDGTESTIPHTCPDELRLEARFDRTTADALRELGHPVSIIGPWEAAGSAMVIRRDSRTGALGGGADPRRDGYAIAW